MKEQIIGNLSAVIKALNAITVCGKENLCNLSGSIAVLEGIQQALSGIVISTGDTTCQGGKTGADAGCSSGAATPCGDEV